MNGGDLEVYAWDKKKRAMLRNLREGDYFCFELPDGNGFGCGRLIAKVSVGHTVEIFNGFEEVPGYIGDWELRGVRLYEVIDSYSLFDKKKEGDWRVVASDGQLAQVVERKNVWFGYGSAGDRQKVNVLGEKLACTEDEYLQLPKFRPAGNKAVMKGLGL